MSSEAGVKFAESARLMAVLRGPEGCPWDREQTLATIRKYTVEEVYEVIDAIDRDDWNDLVEELGDLVLQILFYAQLAEDEGKFGISDVLEVLNRKLVRRHPHVFGEEAAAEAGNAAVLGDQRAETPAQVLSNWDAIKKAEKNAKTLGKASLLDGVPRTFPALLEAAKLGSKAAKVGFDWPDVAGLFAKMQEEMLELQAELGPSGNRERIEEEVGDLLFTAANLARHLKVDPEVALRGANAKFRRRFAAMETSGSLEEKSADELETLWEDVKLRERR